MKKMWKRFWTLSKRQSGGFTLVELIVVIAILAILAGVGVPVYSGYVKKANMQADMTLVSDVAKALQLHYYNSIANNTEMESGYVVLTPVGQACGFDEAGNAAMIAAFGEDWENTLSLKYDGWNVENGLLDEILGYSDAELETIVNSSYVKNCSSEGLMSTVTGLTNLVGDVIREKSADRDKARRNLTTLFGADSDILAQLDQLEEDGLTAEDYPTAISNLLVNTMASTVETEPYLQAMMNQYAAAYAYGEKSGDWAAYEKMQETLKNITMGELSYEGEYAADVGKATMLDPMMEWIDGEEVPAAEYAGFIEYINITGANQVANDEAALSVMMGAVKEISDQFVDVDSVTNSNLYSTDEVANQLNEYMNAVKTVKSMKDSGHDLSNLTDGVMVMIAADGTVSASPGAAWLMP